MLTMSLLKDIYGVCRLDRGSKIPDWAYEGPFYSISNTEDELSIVCVQKNIPDGLLVEKDWRVLKVEGPLDFELVGILASISKVLADCKISIFAISTYDTDYILVKDLDLDNAIKALKEAEYTILK